MLLMVAMSVVMALVNMGLQVCFWAAAAYWVAKMAHRGWRAGK